MRRNRLIGVVLVLLVVGTLFIMYQPVEMTASKPAVCSSLSLVQNRTVLI